MTKITIFAVAALSVVCFSGCKDEVKRDNAPAKSAISNAVDRAVKPLKKAGRQSNPQLKKLNELKQIGLAVAMFSIENDKMPGALSQIAGHCQGIDLSPYAYVGANIPVRYSAPPKLPIAFEKPGTLDGDTVIVLYMDGHVEVKTISGIGKMDCRQAAEKLTADVQDQSVKKMIISNAGKIK